MCEKCVWGEVGWGGASVCVWGGGLGVRKRGGGGGGGWGGARGGGGPHVQTDPGTHHILPSRPAHRCRLEVRIREKISAGAQGQIGIRVK